MEEGSLLSLAEISLPLPTQHPHHLAPAAKLHLGTAPGHLDTTPCPHLGTPLLAPGHCPAPLTRGPPGLPHLGTTPPPHTCAPLHCWHLGTVLPPSPGDHLDPTPGHHPTPLHLGTALLPHLGTALSPLTKGPPGTPHLGTTPPPLTCAPPPPNLGTILTPSAGDRPALHTWAPPHSPHLAPHHPAHGTPQPGPRPTFQGSPRSLLSAQPHARHHRSRGFHLPSASEASRSLLPAPQRSPADKSLGTAPLLPQPRGLPSHPTQRQSGP